MATLWINGRILAAEEAALDPSDRGFTLGDGLFETVLAQRGAMPRLPRHLARLRASTAQLRLVLPWSDEDLRQALAAVLEADGLTAGAALRLTVSRGAGPRGLALPPSGSPTVVISAQPFDGYPAELAQRGLHLVRASVARFSQAATSRMKTLSALDAVLARDEATRAGADDVLLLNEHGRVACLSAANLFAAVDGAWLTPPLGDGIVPGTTRALLIEQLCTEPVQERSLLPTTLAAATEVLACNALMGVLPVCRLDGQPIGTGVPGPWTTALMHAWRDLWHSAASQL